MSLDYIRKKGYFLSNTFEKSMQLYSEAETGKPQRLQASFQKISNILQRKVQ